MEKARDENPFKYPGEILCDKCRKGGKLVYCDSCDSHYHLTCQNPPLQEVPENNDWKCNKCMQEKAAETEDTSNGEEEVEGQRNGMNDDVDVASSSTANQDQQNMNDSVEVEEDVMDDDDDEEAAVAAEEPANDAHDATSNSSVSAGGEQQGNKRPNSEEEKHDQSPAKKARNASSCEEDTSMTSCVSDEVVSGVDAEMAVPPRQQADNNEEAA